MGCIMVHGMMVGPIRPLDAAIAALVAMGVVNASAELQRWAPSANVETASDMYVRPVFCGLFCN